MTVIRVGRVAMVCLVAAACVGCSSGAAQRDVTPPAPTPITGPTSLEVSFMRRLLAKNPPGTIRSVDVTPPPASMLMRDDGTIDRNRYSSRDVWLVVTVPAVAARAADGKAPLYEIPIWKGEVFAMAVQTEMFRATVHPTTHDLRAVVGFTVSAVNASGRRTNSETVSTQGWPQEDARMAYLAGDAAVRHAVVAQLASEGITRGGHGAVTLQSVTLFEGVDPAPIVQLRATSGVAGARTTFGSSGVGTPPYEGYVVVVDGPTGTPVALGANVGRAHYGSGWTDPKYDDGHHGDALREVPVHG